MLKIYNNIGGALKRSGEITNITELQDAWKSMTIDNEEEFDLHNETIVDIYTEFMDIFTIDESNSIELINNFKENILYRAEDNKFIILIGEHHEINTTHKTLIIHKLIELVQKYELDLFIEEKFNYRINARYTPLPPHEHFINVQYLYDKIKELKSIKSRIHNVDIRDLFCSLSNNNYFDEFLEYSIVNLVKLVQPNCDLIDDEEFYENVNIIENFIKQEIFRNTGYNDFRNEKLLLSGKEKLHDKDKEKINNLLDNNLTEMRDGVLDLINNLSIRFSEIKRDRYIYSFNESKYYILEILRQIQKGIFDLYMLIMDIYTLTRMLKKYVQTGIFFGGSLHADFYKNFLLQSGFTQPFKNN